MARPLALGLTRPASGSGYATPPPTTPTFDAFQGRPRMLLRRNSSLSSLSSFAGSDQDEDECQVEWTDEEEAALRAAWEQHTSQRPSPGSSPFGPGAPPSNLAHLVAKSVIASRASSGSSKRTRTGRARKDALMGTTAHASAGVTEEKWRHSLKATRAKLLVLVKQGSFDDSMPVDATPRPGDVDETPKKHRKQLTRQGSMDFLPVARNPGLVARLSSKLHRAAPAVQTSQASNAPPIAWSRSVSAQLMGRGRLHRTASLSSIAGSPTQVRRAHEDEDDEDDECGRRKRPSKMARTGSDNIGLERSFANLRAAAASSQSRYDEPTNGRKRSGTLATSTVDTSATYAPFPSFEAAPMPAVGTSAAGRKLGSLMLPPASSCAPPATGGLASAFSSPTLGATPRPTFRLPNRPSFTSSSSSYRTGSTLSSSLSSWSSNSSLRPGSSNQTDVGSLTSMEEFSLPQHDHAKAEDTESAADETEQEDEGMSDVSDGDAGEDPAFPLDDMDDEPTMRVPEPIASYSFPTFDSPPRATSLAAAFDAPDRTPKPSSGKARATASAYYLPSPKSLRKPPSIGTSLNELSIASGPSSLDSDEGFLDERYIAAGWAARSSLQQLQDSEQETLGEEWIEGGPWRL